MYTTKYRLAILVLTILVLYSGVSIENVSADYAPVITSVNKINSYTASADTKLSDMHFCTAKLLISIDHTETPQFLTRGSNKKRETKWSLDFLCSHSLSFQQEDHSVSSEPVEILLQGPDEIVILYIHEADGKKRI